MNCQDFEAAMKQPSPHLQIFRVTRAWQRITGRWQKVIPVLLVDRSVFLGERDLSRASFRFAMPLHKVHGLVPAPNTRLYASWIERSFATPSPFPTALALTSRSTLLLHSFGSCFKPFPHAVVHVTITVNSKKCNR